MQRIHLMQAAWAALFMLNSCAYVPHDHMHDNWYRRHEVSSKNLVVTDKYCDGVRCNRVVHFDEKCQARDEAGNPITEIKAYIGTRICVYNDSGCPIRLKSGDVLFGPKHSIETLETGQCVNLTVTLQAKGQTFTLETVCACPGGRPHTNPTVRVGEDKEPDDGG